MFTRLRNDGVMVDFAKAEAGDAAVTELKVSSLGDPIFSSVLLQLFPSSPMDPV